nr:hypothetical protein [Tanacetum cinerariifolium]
MLLMELGTVVCERSIPKSLGYLRNNMNYNFNVIRRNIKSGSWWSGATSSSSNGSVSSLDDKVGSCNAGVEAAGAGSSSS